MNKKILTTAILASIAGTAHAQSSVTLYGIIDAGITYTNHSGTGGNKLFKYDDGVAQGSRWGMRGAEDLGGGLKAIFVLESGFNSGNGTMGQSSTLFGRQAYVGLSKNGIGSVTFGRQYTFNTDFLGSNYSTGGNTVAGNYAYHYNDIDQLTSSRINNAVKFTSANFSGLTFGVLYGFSNQAGAFAGAPSTSGGAGSSRTISFGANYAMGPFAIGGAYSDIRFPGQQSPQALPTSLFGLNAGATGSQIKELRSFGFGGRYVFGPATAWLLWTNTLLDPTAGSSLTFNAYEAGVKYAVTTALSGALGYTYSRTSGAFNAHWNQVNAAVDYALSKRTDVYLLGVYQSASGSVNGNDVFAGIGDSTSFFGTNAGSDSQVAVRVGIRHKF